MKNIHFRLKQGRGRTKIIHGPLDADLQPGVTYTCTLKEWRSVFSRCDSLETIDTDSPPDEHVGREHVEGTPVDDVRLGELQYDDAIRRAGDCVDAAWLEAELAVEKRKTVRAAIEERLEELKESKEEEGL